MWKMFLCRKRSWVEIYGVRKGGRLDPKFRVRLKSDRKEKVKSRDSWGLILREVGALALCKY